MLQPIYIDDFQDNVIVLEDYHGRKLLLPISISDGNDANQDNVTCIIINNPDPTLIELVDDGNHGKNCNNTTCLTLVIRYNLKYSWISLLSCQPRVTVTCVLFTIVK